MTISDFFIPAVFSFLFTLVGTFAALKIFPKLGFMDKPEKYGLNRSSIPYMGGIVIFLSFLLSTVIFVDLDKKVLGLILAAFLIVFVSFWDDRVGLSPWFRLGIQILAGIIVVLAGVKIQLITNPFGDPFYLDIFKFEFFGQEIWVLSAIFIIVWLGLMMNVMNWLDGIPGLSSGIGVIASLTMFGLSVQGFHIVPQDTIIILTITLASSLLAYWIFDFSPPKILMGDTGSMLIGFLLGMFAIFSGGKIATALLIMAFPVLDAIWVIIRRILTGKSPMKGDLDHLHHRFLRIGLTPRKALLVNYFLAASFGGIALFLDNTREKFIALLILTAMMIVTAIVIVSLEKKKLL